MSQAYDFGKGCLIDAKNLSGISNISEHMSTSRILKYKLSLTQVLLLFPSTQVIKSDNLFQFELSLKCGDTDIHRTVLIKVLKTQRITE